MIEKGDTGGFPTGARQWFDAIAAECFDIADDEYAASTQAIVPKGAARSAIAIRKAPVRNRANPARRRQEE